MSTAYRKQLMQEREQIEKRLALINVRCDARDRLEDRLELVNDRIAQIGY